jgi:hypothetical protein
VSINCAGFTGTLATGGNSKTLSGSTALWNSPVTCTITGAPTITASSMNSGTRIVACNHASPSATNSINFTFAVGSHTVALSGTGFRNLSITFPGVVTGTVSVYGNVTLGATGTSTNFSPTFLAAATYSGAGRTISSATVNAPGATVTTSGAMTLGVTNTFTLTAGTLSLGGTLSTGIFSSSNTNTRAIAFGANNIALTSTTAAATVLSMSTATGFTMTTSGGGFTRNQAATSNIQFGPTGGTASNACNLTINAGASQATISSGSYFKNITFTGSTCTVVGGGGGGTINTAGNLTLAAGGTYTSVGFGFVGSATVSTLGKTISNMLVNGSGITVTLAGAVTTSSSGNGFALTEGTLNLAGFTLSTSIFTSSNTNTRAITFGSGNIALTSTTSSALVLDMDQATGFTWTGTGGFTRNQAATATIFFGSAAGGTTANAPNFTVNAGTLTLTINVSSWFKNLIFTGSACTVSGTVNIAGNLTLGSGGTYTAVNPTFRASGTVTSLFKTLGNTTINGTGITVTLADVMQVGITNTTTLTEGTLDLAGSSLDTGIFNSSNVNTRAISFSTGNIALTSTTGGATVLNMAQANNFTWTGTGGFTRNMAATATMVFGTTGGTTSNAPNLTVNTGASTLTITSGSYFKNVIFTGSTCTVSASGLSIAGNLTLASGGTYTSVVPTFVATATVTSAGKQLGSTTINGSGITVTLADALTSSDTLTLTQGTFTAANFNVTAGLFSSSNSNTRTLNMGSGTWTITSNLTAWNTATVTGLTFNPSTSTISMTAAIGRSFAGGGLTYYNLNQGSAGALIISGSNTFNDITNTVQPSTVTFTAGTTQTVSNFSLAGTAGNLVTINSSSTGSQFTLSKASGTVNAQFLSIRDSNATGGATWNALFSTNLGNNTGWIFPGGNMFLMFM